MSENANGQRGGADPSLYGTDSSHPPESFAGNEDYDNATDGGAESETSLTALPQENLKRVQISIEQSDYQFANLLASLEWQILEKFDIPLSGSILSDAFAGDGHEGEDAPGVGAPSVFGVTSALVGEGKTTVAMHLAFSIARNSYKKVCLIDMGLGDDEICRRLGVKQSFGVANILDGEDSVIQTLEVADCGDLSIMPGGPLPQNTTRAARSPAVPEVITAARQMFDIIIVDLPAVLTGNALPIATYLDRVLMVVCAGVTPRDVVNDALDRIGRKRTLGVVLNRIKPSSPIWVQKRLARI
jgi:Mrp family chromosome partitioning ATPase